MIIPFDVTIPEEQRNPNLAKEIIAGRRLRIQLGAGWITAAFDSEWLFGVRGREGNARKFGREIHSVAMFIGDEGYSVSSDRTVKLTELYPLYRDYCRENGSHAVS